MNQNLQKIGENLRKVVEAKGIPHHEFAQRSGISYNTLNNIMKGRDAKIGTILAICEAHDVDIDSIISGRSVNIKRLGGSIAYRSINFTLPKYNSRMGDEAFDVADRSMEPDLLNGSVVVGSLVERIETPDLYVIVTETQTLIRHCRMDGNNIKAIPSNEDDFEYPIMHFNPKDVERIYKVRREIRIV